MTNACDGVCLLHLLRLEGVLVLTMQCIIQNMGKTPVKNQYRKFLHINNVHWALCLQTSPYITHRALQPCFASSSVITLSETCPIVAYTWLVMDAAIWLGSLTGHYCHIAQFCPRHRQAMASSDITAPDTN